MLNDLERIREALQFIPVGGNPERWRVAAMIFSEVGEAGRDLWDEWRGDRGNDDAASTWRSASKDGALKIGTLFHESKANGWRDDGSYQKPTPEVLADRRRRAAERAAKEKAETEREHAEAATKAAAIWKDALPAREDHPYLARKRVKPVKTLRELPINRLEMLLGYPPKSKGEPLAGRVLVAPVKVGDRVFSTLELIDEAGWKSAIYGGQKSGGFWAAQLLPDGDGAGVTLLIGEGVVTCLSAREATGHPVVAALSSGNLLAVAKAMQERYPAAALVFLADLVKATGVPDPHAIEAARAVGGTVAIPNFGTGRLVDDKDMNDLARVHGLDAVARCIVSAAAPVGRMPAPGEHNAAIVDSVGDEWPVPLPIPSALLPVEPFDLELLPVSIRAWVADIAERMQCPPDFPAVGAMVALSSVIGRKACIAPKRRDDWRVIPNLWGAVVGRPGVMKSPALSEIMKPLDRLALLAGDLHKEAMRNFEINSKIEGMGGKEAERKAQVLVGKGKAEEARHLLTQVAEAEGDTPPALRRYKVTDASVEALGEILIENPWGTLAYRDELNGLLRSLDKEGQEGARAFYLQGYDGNQGYTFDRIMRGRNLHIRAVCISMLGGIQPGKLQAYIRDAVSGGAGDDGLLQRFGLLVWPDVGGEWRNVDRFPDTPAKQAAFEVFQKLDAMLPGTDPETDEPAAAVYRFSPEAQDEFDNWRQIFETDLRSGDHHPAMESHLSKYRKLVPALALVCALTDGETEVSHDSLMRALAWSEYLQSHAARAYGAGTGLDTNGAAALLSKIIAGKVTDGFKPADVYWNGWANLGTPDAVHAAARILCGLGHLRETVVRPEGAGRPSIIYRINPATLAGVRS